MALISIPKHLIDNYGKAAAKNVGTATSDLERLAVQNIVNDPGTAMLAVLRPYLKGDLLHLNMMYSYGDIEVLDENDGYYRMEIPDQYLSETLPRDFGTVTPPQRQPKCYSEEVQGQLLADLAFMAAPLALQIERNQVQSFMQRCSRSFSRVLGVEVDERKVMAQLASNLQAGQEKWGPTEVMDAADRISAHLDDEEKVELAAAFREIAGVNAQTPEHDMSAMVFHMSCMGLGVEWDRERGKGSIDPAGTLKKIALRMRGKDGGGFDHKLRIPTVRTFAWPTSAAVCLPPSGH